MVCNFHTMRPVFFERLLNFRQKIATACSGYERLAPWIKVLGHVKSLAAAGTTTRMRPYAGPLLASITSRREDVGKKCLLEVGGA